jgi:threonine dehydratase
LSITVHGRHIPLTAIRDAATAIYDAAVRTPLVRLELDSAPEGSPAPVPEVYLKLEVLQPIGSFKIRGAYNVVRQLTRDELKDGVWTVSAGNPAQGVALAAQKVGARCAVMVMDTAPDTKIRAIERLGATIVRATYDECWQTVESHGSDRMNGYFVHPFDDDRFIAGNGTAGLEILEDLPDVDAVVAAFGGGGLSCGIASVMRMRQPRVKVFAAEPETASPLARSFAAGAAQDFPEWQASWVDGCGGKGVFPRMWALAGHLLEGSVVCPLEDIRRAMKLVAERNHVIAEGAGACAVAAALSGQCGGGKVVAVVSGGNIDLDRFRELIST